MNVGDVFRYKKKGCMSSTASIIMDATSRFGAVLNVCAAISNMYRISDQQQKVTAWFDCSIQVMQPLWAEQT